MEPFLDLLGRAGQLVEQQFPGSKFYEADGRPSSGSATNESDVDTWRFVFLGPRQQNRTTSVFLEYNQGAFGTPTLKPEPVLGDHVIVPPHWPITMSLTKAITLLHSAGFSSPFKSVILRWPLSPGNEEPFYIFGETGGSFVFVGTESGVVTYTRVPTGNVALQVRPADGSDQIRLCTASGLVFRAFRRPYSGAVQVLTLLASGYYDVAPWELFFVSDGGSVNKYKLMEKRPTHYYHLRTFYSPCMCSHYGLEGLGDVVTVEDAFGEHQVPVEDFGPPTPQPGPITGAARPAMENRTASKLKPDQWRFDGVASTADVSHERLPVALTETLGKAIADAVGKAKDSLGTDLVSWVLADVTGQTGGFTELCQVGVSIYAKVGV